jgi:adenine-specific DNA-methyltransferase
MVSDKIRKPRMREAMSERIRLLKNVPSNVSTKSTIVWNGDVASVLKRLPEKRLFDLVVTSPPYNIGKAYEVRTSLDEYVKWHSVVIAEMMKRIKPTGSVCWQVGNYVENGSISPLDYIFHPIFEKFGLRLRNRIVWHFGHGLHQRKRFSGRYEVVLWYTKSDEYSFNLDSVRVPPKYPAKRAYRGPRAGEFSSHPLGKNPEDVWKVADSAHDLWSIPNVKAGHVEKTEHPCQFPVGLVERLVLALTNRGDLIFDPFAGTASAGVAALVHKRHFWGCEIDSDYSKVAYDRLRRTTGLTERFRSHALPVYDHTKSKLSVAPRRD